MQVWIAHIAFNKRGVLFSAIARKGGLFLRKQHSKYTKLIALTHTVRKRGGTRDDEEREKEETTKKKKES